MRAVPALLLLLLAGSPAALAAGYTLGVERTAEATVAPGDAPEFAFPLLVEQDGALYAKVLASRSNAVHDGAEPNGTLSTGWRVGFAMTYDGIRAPLGTRFDGEPTDLVPVRRGENATLHVTIHTPDDAALAGSTQKVFVALAYRAPGGEAGASGGVQDEARALTMLLHVPADTAPPVASPPTTPTATDPAPPTPDVQPIPTSGSTRVIVEQQAPDWFFAGVLVFLAIIAACAVLLTRARLAREAATDRTDATRRVPVHAEEEKTAPSRETPRH